ncbi:MAG: T9SS type A sorting domain-containing protein [Bacteroidota bacterium]
MKKLILLSLFTISFFAKAQNLPACDSLLISCCTYDSLGPNTLTIYASNPSSVLFDYPGFVLLNATNDTIAKETVSYFGIGTGPQPHTLQIVAPLILPFQGKLELFSLFYQSLDCTFPFYIPDTIASVRDLQKKGALNIYPNPAVNSTMVELDGFDAGNNLSIGVYDVMGREVMRTEFDHSPMEISVKELSEGTYVIRIFDQNLFLNSKVLIVGR